MKKASDQTEFTEETALAFFARHLDGLEWKYHRYPEKPVLYSGFNGDRVQWDYSLYARETSPGLFLLGVNSFIPTKTPADRRPAIMELLTRINFDLSVGCFELDLADGEIRFRTSTILPGTDITTGIIEHLLRSNLSIVDERFPQIAAVLFSGASPEDALKPKEPEDKSQPRFDFN
ncbi:MAG: YbjN domain-containing protein [Verrucomicrobiota bacterium]